MDRNENHIFSGALERSAGMENGILFEVLLFITNLNALIHNKLQLSASVFYGSLKMQKRITEFLKIKTTVLLAPNSYDLGNIKGPKFDYSETG